MRRDGISLYLLDLNGGADDCQRQRAGQEPFGFTYDADKRLVPVPERQKELRRFRTLHAKGLFTLQDQR